jgi:hypothetical protein
MESTPSLISTWPGHRQRFDSLDGMPTELGAVHLSGFAPKPEENYANLCDFLTGPAGVVPAKLGPLKTRAREAFEPLSFGSGEAIGKRHGVPELRTHYLPRAEDIARLKQKLLGGKTNVGITAQSAADFGAFRVEQQKSNKKRRNS